MISGSLEGAVFVALDLGQATMSRETGVLYREA
jgi:hypothetical protein